MTTMGQSVHQLVKMKILMAMLAGVHVPLGNQITQGKTNYHQDNGRDDPVRMRILGELGLLMHMLNLADIGLHEGTPRAKTALFAISTLGA
jgi:hypothetical protein